MIEWDTKCHQNAPGTPRSPEVDELQSLHTPTRRDVMRLGACLAVGGTFAATSQATELPFDEYAKYDGLGLADLVRRKEVKPEDLLEAAIIRTEAVNPRINAVVVELYDQARRAIAAGLPDGPFRGVPCLVKDPGFWMKGVECSDGSQLLPKKYDRRRI